MWVYFIAVYQSPFLKQAAKRKSDWMPYLVPNYITEFHKYLILYSTTYCEVRKLTPTNFSDEAYLMVFQICFDQIWLIPLVCLLRF